MRHPSFDSLLAKARAAHATLPALSGFCPFPDDLTAQPVTPLHIPAADLLAQDAGLFSPDLSVFRDAFVAASPAARWRETYKGTDIGQDFIDRFGCYALIGTGGPWVSEQMASFVVYMPAGLHYRWHQHPAEELYLVIAGQAEFRRKGEPPETLGPGDTSFHASNQPHGMTTHDHPVMAYVLWRNHLGTPPVLGRCTISPKPALRCRTEYKTRELVKRDAGYALNTSSTGFSPVTSALVWLAMPITASNSPCISGVMPLAFAAAVCECTQYSQPFAVDTATYSISLTNGSSAPGAITTFSRSHVARNNAGSCASARQKLLMKPVPRRLRISVKTASSSVLTSSSLNKETVPIQTIAKMRAGPPEPPRCFGAPTTSVAPLAGTLSKFLRHSMP